MMRLLIALLVCSRLAAAEYFFDLDAGVDSNTGTSQGSPWKTPPGARNVGDTADAQTSWGGGTISSANKVQPGDTLKFKPGTTWSSADGGKLMINSTYYSTSATESNPITFQCDTSWAAGVVTINGSGVTDGGSGFGIFHSTISGIIYDGNGITNGITIANSPHNGVSDYASSYTEGPYLKYCMLTNCGTAYASSPTSDDAAIRFRMGSKKKVENCTILGNLNNNNGICFGDGNSGSTIRTTWDAWVKNTYIRDQEGTDDDGIAIKGFNSQITVTNCTVTNCYKGIDMGEYNGGGQSNFVYKVLNSSFIGNAFGINMNIVGDCTNKADFSATANFTISGNVVANSSEKGCNIYGGPYNLYFVNNTFTNNGSAAFGGSSLTITPQNGGCSGAPVADPHVIRVYFYNNICDKPATSSDCNLEVQTYRLVDNDFSFESDYNAWFQKASEDVVWWSDLGPGEAPPGANNTTYAYGANGIGQTSGNWYSWYSYDTTAPTVGGIGHFHADSHSKGTGSSVSTTAPSYGANYTLSAAYSGTSISSQPWYNATDMGTDRNGVTRGSDGTWDMGAFEFDAGGGGGGGSVSGSGAPGRVHPRGRGRGR